MRSAITACCIALAGCTPVIKKQYLSIDIDASVMQEPRSFEQVPKDANYEKLLGIVIRNNTTGVITAEQLRTLQSLIRTHNNVVNQANK